METLVLETIRKDRPADDTRDNAAQMWMSDEGGGEGYTIYKGHIDLHRWRGTSTKRTKMVDALVLYSQAVDELMLL